jgi:catechol 2,3-dioxygenase
MSFHGVLRPGHVQLRVLDLDEAARHYRDVLGLERTATDPAGRAYFKAWDEFDHHSVVLRAADEAGMDHMAFKVVSPDDLAALETKLERIGVRVERIAKGEQLGTGERIGFVAPTGHRFELYAEKDAVGNGLPTTNPHVFPDGLRGMKATRLDHCLLYGDDLDGSVRIFIEALGFHLSERVLAGDGQTMIGAFLSCSNKPHDVAFIRHPEKNRFHHASFFLDDWSCIQHAADLIARNDVPLDIGPTRHGITRGLTIYFFDPSGNRNEVFAGGYIHYPDRPTITWTEDQLGKAIFYYERCLNDRFLSVTT